jgi:phosphatidylglycerophosphate synthase
MLDNVTTHVEKRLPASWTANTVTIIGNIGMVLAGSVAIAVGGLKYHDTTDMPRWVFALAAICIQWFSWFDMMDGQRARRLKCGSPIGRIIDEAGDAYQYTFVAVITGFIVKLPPGWLTLSYGFINLPMYSMEMKYIFTGSLKITQGDVGPVEIELLFAIIFASAAFFGTSGMTSPVSESVAWLQWNHVAATVFVCLQIFFTLENLTDCIKMDFKRTLKYLLGPFLILGVAILSAWLGTETFREEFVIFHLLHSLAFNVTSYRLMLSNMTKSSFKVYGLENFIAAFPLFIHLVAPSKVHKMVFEPFVSYFCIFALYLLFYIHIFFLSNQFLCRNPDRRFWTIKK